jgi:hypothetical protein
VSWDDLVALTKIPHDYHRNPAAMCRGTIVELDSRGGFLTPLNGSARVMFSRGRVVGAPRVGASVRFSVVMSEDHFSCGRVFVD